MGYLREAIGIKNRYHRCQHHWRTHVENCRTTILNALLLCERRRKAVILGAGLLHDVPLAELSAAFDKVVLVDIVHPVLDRLTLWPFKNVERLSADVTNTVNEVYRVSDEPDLPLPESKPDLLLDDPEVDLTVSLNILSQLPCVPLEYLERFKAHSREQMNRFARDLIQAHLAYLRWLPGVVVLITDIERTKIDLSGKIVERKDLLYGLEQPKAEREWEWRLAPCPEADPKHHFYRRVIAGVINRIDRS